MQCRHSDRQCDAMIHFPEDVTWVINFNRIVRTGVRWCVLFSGDPLCTGTFSIAPSVRGDFWLGGGRVCVCVVLRASLLRTITKVHQPRSHTPEIVHSGRGRASSEGYLNFVMSGYSLKKKMFRGRSMVTMLPMAMAMMLRRKLEWGRRGTRTKSEEVKGCCRCLKTIAAC